MKKFNSNTMKKRTSWRFAICFSILLTSIIINTVQAEDSFNKLKAEEERLLNELENDSNSEKSPAKIQQKQETAQVKSKPTQTVKSLPTQVNNIKKAQPTIPNKSATQKKAQPISKSTVVPQNNVNNDKFIKKLEGDNAKLKAKVAELERQLRNESQISKSLRGKLMLAEEESNRLNTLVTGASSQPRLAVPTNRRVVNNNPLLTQPQNMKTSPEMPIATVIVDKANLRAGPGKNNSTIMSVAKGTRLAVETNQGDWYRVVTPTGGRAWISRETVGFGNNPQSSPSRTVHVQSSADHSNYPLPVSKRQRMAAEEEQVMDLIRNHPSGKTGQNHP